MVPHAYADNTSYQNIVEFIGRSIGPTNPEDYYLSSEENVPGIVHYYEEDAAFSQSLELLLGIKMFAIPPGHPKEAKAKLYPITPPERRETP